VPVSLPKPTYPVVVLTVGAIMLWEKYEILISISL
jgi:hypothetical protein